VLELEENTGMSKWETVKVTKISKKQISNQENEVRGEITRKLELELWVFFFVCF